LFVTFSRSREIGQQDYNSSENYVVRSFQMMVWFGLPSNDNCTELFGIQEAESAGTVTAPLTTL